jgi:hypothetical protein
MATSSTTEDPVTTQLLECYRDLGELVNAPQKSILRSALVNTVTAKLSVLLKSLIVTDVQREMEFLRYVLCNTKDKNSVSLDRLAEFLPIYYFVAIVLRKYKDQRAVPVCRSLTKDEVEFLISTAAYTREQLASASRPALPKTISLEKFVDWWGSHPDGAKFSLLETFQIIRIYWIAWNGAYLTDTKTNWQGQKLAGYISSDQSAAMLQGKRVGTFLLRFALSGGLSIDYVNDKRQIQRMAIKLQIVFVSSLDYVIMHYEDVAPKIKYIYNTTSEDINKSEAFDEKTPQK